MTKRRRVLGVAAALLGLIAPLPGSGGVRYHTELTGAYPAADSSHTAEVREVRLRFSTAVQPALSAITLLGPGGTVGGGAIEPVPGTEGTEIRLTLSAPLPSGAYTVEWRTAGPDSHVIRGSYTFSVLLPEASPQAAAEPPTTRAEGGPAAPQSVDVVPGDAVAGPAGRTVAVGWIFLVSLAGMIGTVGFRLGVVGPVGRMEGHDAAGARLRRGTRVLGWLTLALALSALPLRLLGQAAAVAGPGEPSTAYVGLVLGTPWGSAWLLHGSAALLFLVGLLMAGGKPEARVPWLVCGLAALLAATVPALSGHAAASGLRLVVVDTVHVLAAGTWLGGLACLVLVGVPSALRTDARSTLAPMVARFTELALPAVTLLIVTGVLNTLDRVTLGELVGSGYGRTLLIKIVAAAGAFSLGFYNWRVVRPALDREGRAGLLGIPASVELFVGLVVLAITAALVVTALP